MEEPLRGADHCRPAEQAVLNLTAEISCRQGMGERSFHSWANHNGMGSRKQLWSLDFVADVADASIGGDRDHLSAGHPDRPREQFAHIVSDNGTEMTNRAMLEQANPRVEWCGIALRGRSRNGVKQLQRPEG